MHEEITRYLGGRSRRKIKTHKKKKIMKGSDKESTKTVGCRKIKTHKRK